MSIITDIAKAVVSTLNEADFSKDFEAVYSVKPGFELAELDTLRVVVVPKQMEIDRISRSSTKYTVSIDVGIMQRIGAFSPEEAVEKLGELVDEIAEFLTETNLKDYDAATFAGISNDPIYIPEHLTSNRTFTSVLTVKYLLLT
jgi:hypothetical protein